MLQGKTAIVTGSTSGIGLGIATALAAEGCDVDAERVRRCRRDRAAARSGLAEEHGVRVGYSPADMSKPARNPRDGRGDGEGSSAASTSWSTTPASSTSPRSSISPRSAGTR